MMFDLLGRRRIAELQDRYNRLAARERAAAERLAAQDGCREALTAVIRDQRKSLDHAAVRLAGGGHQHRLIRAVLAEQLAIAVVDALAGKFAMDLADELAAKAGLDVRADMQTRINEMSGQHAMPRPDLVDGQDAREHTDAETDQPEPGETAERAQQEPAEATT